MFEADYIVIRNFMSFGDYETRVKLSDLGTCLITGEVVGLEKDENGDGEEDSNSAGKSAFVNAFLWCLSGRTMHRANPGDKVVNWFTKKDCYVEIGTKNGDKLIRTRGGKDGHDDLLYIKDGEDISLGTNKMQQEELRRLLNFDYTIFCGSVFFAQYSKPWMEMSSGARKDALEREFHIDRMQLYADVAKEKAASIEKEQTKIRGAINSEQLSINHYNGEMAEMQKASANFTADKQKRVRAAQENLKRLEESRDSIKVPDIEDLKAKWVAVEKIEELLNKKWEVVYQMEAEQRQISNDIDYQQRAVNKWSGKTGICPNCEQPITGDYVQAKIQSPVQKVAELQVQLQEAIAKIAAEKKRLEATKTAMKSKVPETTIIQAKQMKAEWDRRNQNVQAQLRVIDGIEQEENRYDQSIERLKGKMEEAQKRIKEHLKRLKSLDTLVLHWHYVYKAYSDRRKIKAQVLCDYIPYLNERITYYLERFKTKLRIEFTEGLGIKTNYWDYEFFCGGERKRVDIAMMLAMFDLHDVMYGRQCNVIVLDEVDGRLDKRGAKILADIVRTDLADRADTILVISHRTDMRGAFSSEIKIHKEGDLSTIKEILR